MAHGTWQQTGGGGFDPMPIVVIILVIAIAGPVGAAVGGAVAALLQIVLIVAAVLAGLAAVGVTLYVVYRVRRRGTRPALPVSQPAQVTARPVRALPEPRKAIGPAPVHLHFHGVDAEDVAAILREQADVLPHITKE